MFAPLPNTLVIGIGHKARQGKSTFAQHIMRAVPGAERFELSTYVATVARAIYDMRERNVSQLIAVGNGLREQIDPEVWTRCCYFDIVDKAPRIALIPNIRFANETRLVKDMGGILVDVRRRNPDGSLFVSDDRDPSNITETALDDFDGWDYRVTVDNLVDLKREASRILCDAL